MKKLKVCFDIDLTMTSEEAKVKLFTELYEGFDYEKHYTIYPIEKSLYLHGFIKDEPTTKDIKGYKYYNRRHTELFGAVQLAQWFKDVYIFISRDPRFELYFITARNIEFSPYTHDLFGYYGIPTRNVHHIGTYDKLPLIEKLGIDIMFEDNVKTTLSIIENAKLCKAVLVDRPYNRHLEVEGYTRINPHTDGPLVIQLLEELYEKRK